MSKIKENRETLDEIVFENRNKVYGAYQIRKQYKKELNKSLFIVLFIFCTSIGIMLFMSFKEARPGIIIPDDPTYTISEYDIPDFKIPDPPPPSEKNDVAKIEDESRFRIVPNPTSDNDKVELPSNDNIQATNKEVTSEGNSSFEIKKEKTDIIPDDNKTLDEVFVKEPPIFPGGSDALYKFIKENTVYNKEAIEEGIMGKVFVSFIVDKEGNIKDVRIIRGLDPNLDKEAINVIKKMPKWEPGRDDGEPVNVVIRIPINFIIE